jgi:hypothetical protein
MRQQSHFLPFSPGYEFTAARMRPLLIDGVAYRQGDRINKASLSERRLMQLYEQRLIAPVREDAEAPKPSWPTRKIAEPAKPAEADDVNLLADSQVTIKHLGFGKWAVVDAAGNELATKLSKEDAQAIAAGKKPIPSAE